MSTLSQLLRKAAQRLANAGVPDARIEADLIWMTALGIDRAALYASLNDTPSDDASRAAEDLMAKRLRREPMAYLMGRREFYGLDLSVGPGVLIPRPDTETLVEEALRLLRGRSAPVRIADIGCGSGAIGIALAVYLPHAIVDAVDVSTRALEITRLNAERHGVAGRVRTSEGSLLDAVDVPVDCITANLPYVMSAEIPTLEPEVSRYEPREALDGGDDGLVLIRALVAQAPKHLRPGGIMLLEMDPRQIERASAFVHEAFPDATISVVKDLAGRDRVVVIET